MPQPRSDSRMRSSIQSFSRSHSGTAFANERRPCGATAK